MHAELKGKSVRVVQGCEQTDEKSNTRQSNTRGVQGCEEMAEQSYTGEGGRGNEGALAKSQWGRRGRVVQNNRPGEVWG